MNVRTLVPAALLLIGAARSAATQTPSPADPARDARLAWFREAKYGLFIHWGLYAIPAGRWNGQTIPGIGEWIMNRAKIPVAEYSKLATQFNPAKFDADGWVRMAKDAGMKYIVITAKHHDGFALFRSSVSPFNVVDATPFKRDVLKELAAACAKQGIRLGFYYSQSQDWHEPNGAGNTWDFGADSTKDYDAYLRGKAEPQVKELLTKYGPVALLWFDTPRMMTGDRATRFTQLVRTLQPATLIDGRLGESGDYISTGDNAIPSDVRGEAWEVPATLNHTWGYRTDDQDWKSPGDVVFKLVDIVSKGGNYLLNVGPMPNGQMPQMAQDILRTAGRWLKLNGEAVYGAQATPFGDELGEPSARTKDASGRPIFLTRTGYRITAKPGKLYFTFFAGQRNPFQLPHMQNAVRRAYRLADGKPFEVREVNGEKLLTTTGLMDTDPMATVIVVEIEGGTPSAGGTAEQARAQTSAEAIPLPEHPRPDFQRADWINLNGPWRFKFDAADRGEPAGWFNQPLASPHSILVPFSWGAPLSGVADSADIGWYQRSITVPSAWRGKRVFLVVGASDWRTSVWLNDTKVGEHQGGYTPFSIELTKTLEYGSAHRLTLRVDDTEHPFKLEGKQGYGKARGLWQTIYLEARGDDPLDYIHFTPNVTAGRVAVEAKLHEPAPKAMTLRLAVTPGSDSITRTPAPVVQSVVAGARVVRFDIPMVDAHLWSPDDPHLYHVTATVRGDGMAADSVDTYFAMREISVVNLPGTTIPYVALNGRPIYLQLALDQAYHPRGFYTFPTDSALRFEILKARQIGLTGLREHIKIEAPRKLYWADRLGVLIMADVPNWWGPPDSVAFAEHDYAMRQMIERDYNHPSIFSWVTYNEAWGLPSKVNGKDVYLPATMERVIESVRLAKSLDPTRLVEDNSPCCGRGHTETDLNSWHEYLPGWRWESRVSMIADSTFPGSTWNFERGYAQARQPMLNSEFGNVWGYRGSSGDVDWSWDYHLAVNAFRRHAKLAGWLYTELDDVINEWNGYWRADRSKKDTGLGDLVDGMSLRDLHAPFYVVVGSGMSELVQPGATVHVPLYASFLSDSRALGDSLTLRFELYGWDALGERKTYSTSSRRVPNRPWLSEALAPAVVTMPSERAVAVFATRLEDAAGAVLQRNFTTFVVDGAAPREMTLAGGQRVRLAHASPVSYTAARWSTKTWAVDSLKANGAGSGFFEYRIAWPSNLRVNDVEAATFVVEASAKRLLGKDRDTTVRDDSNYMRGGGLQDPSGNRNAYPMTGEVAHPSAVVVRVNGELAGRYDLADDPADHRGVLSWFSQKRDGYLREAGSYGQLLRVPIPAAALAKAARAGEVVVRLEVDDAVRGGLAIYGARFGRYPVDPTVAFVLRNAPNNP